MRRLIHNSVMNIMRLALTLLVACGALAGFAHSDPLAHTYSIVARDSDTGEIGVAAQSHWFAIGTVVTWARAGVGAVATQSFIDPAYGRRGLKLMRAGASAPQVLRRLVAADAQRSGRQVAMIDAKGRASAYTGDGTIAFADHHVGHGYSVQANMMSNERVVPAMARAFESAEGDLAARLLAALEAAERAGGDVRGAQSAALLVVEAEDTGRPWVGGDHAFDLRVDDHAAPVTELRRLLRLQRAYAHANHGDELLTAGQVAAALAEYETASRLAPEINELPFWHAVALASTGRVQEALPIFKTVFAKEPVWAEVLARLPESGLFPDNRALMRRIQKFRP